MFGRIEPIELPACVSAKIAGGERVYAIGDVHGRLDLLRALVAHVRADSAARGPARVRLILLGDLIDRGPQSAEVVARCRALAARSDDFIVLKGNHEAMMVDGLRGNPNAFALWLRSGGDAALESWGVAEAAIAGGPSLELIDTGRRRIPAETIAWLDSLPPSQRLGDYLFVHAGIRPGVAHAGQTPEDMLWIRRDFLESEADHGCIVVHGHSIAESGVVIRPNRIGIDTGAYRSNVLTALGLEADRRWTLSTSAAHAANEGAGDLEADVAAMLGLGKVPAPVAPASRRNGPKYAVATIAAIAFASLAAVLLLRAPDRPPVAPNDATPSAAMSSERVPGPAQDSRSRVEIASATVSGPPPPASGVAGTRPAGVPAATDDDIRRDAPPLAVRSATPSGIRILLPDAPVTRQRQTTATRTASIRPRALPEPPAGPPGDAASIAAPDSAPPPVAQMALASNPIAPPNASPIASPPPAETPDMREKRLRTQRSIDAIRVLRRQ